MITEQSKIKRYSIRKCRLQVIKGRQINPLTRGRWEKEMRKMKHQRGVTYVLTFRGFFEVQWLAREVEAGCEMTAGPADSLMHALLTQQSHEVILNGEILDYITKQYSKLQNVL